MILILVLFFICLSLTVSFRAPFKRISTRHESTKIFYERLIDPSELGSDVVNQIDLLYGIYIDVYSKRFLFMYIYIHVYIDIYLCLYEYMNMRIRVYTCIFM
jgi:hypothetical protein